MVTHISQVPVREYRQRQIQSLYRTRNDSFSRHQLGVILAMARAERKRDFTAILKRQAKKGRV